MSMKLSASEIITVPGESTSSSAYFFFIESESFPVGTLMPSSMANSETACTASYNRASSPSFLHGHIQFAESDTFFKPSFKGAQMRFVKASVIEFRLPATGSINPEIGEWPMDVATPSLPQKRSEERRVGQECSC